jgi:hypothetical protein
MNRKRLARAALSVLIGWGVWAGLARAGDPNTPNAGAPIYYSNTLSYTSDPSYYPKTPPQATVLPPGYPPVDSSPKHFPIAQRLIHGRPLGCWASFNSYSCSSLKSELGFVFGSCRTFYSEPCLKGAPPSPLPPWVGAASGYRQYPPWGYPPPGYFAEGTYPRYGAEAQRGCGCP